MLQFICKICGASALFISGVANIIRIRFLQVSFCSYCVKMLVNPNGLTPLYALSEQKSPM